MKWFHREVEGIEAEAKRFIDESFKDWNEMQSEGQISRLNFRVIFLSLISGYIFQRPISGLNFRVIFQSQIFGLNFKVIFPCQISGLNFRVLFQSHFSGLYFRLKFLV